MFKWQLAVRNVELEDVLMSRESSAADHDVSQIVEYLGVRNQWTRKRLQHYDIKRSWPKENYKCVSLLLGMSSTLFFSRWV